MNKYVLIVILSLITNAFLHSPVQAQLCGGGTITFTIYTLNGSELENINYELLPVNMDSIKNDSHPPYFDLNRGEIVSAFYVKKTVDASKEKELDRQLAFRENKKKGAVNNGVVHFKTLETAHHPCILHLYSNKKDVYILANLIGGCNRKTGVLWNENPQLVATY
jgi:hypothetical protein